MVHHLVRGCSFVAIATTLALGGCGKLSPSSLDRPAHSVAAQAPAGNSAASPSENHRRGGASEKLPTASAPHVEQYPGDDPPSWLDELLHSSDPNVRIQGLDAWARQPGVSLDPVTYALVDPDESVRARAQELFEQQLARR